MTRKDKKFGKVAVLMGGPSAEREVSLKSGGAVLAALLRQGVEAHAVDPDRRIVEVLRDGGFDRAFIALHGRWGEDGIIQGALETIQMPYTGSRVLGSALGMDKLRCKQLWLGCGLPTPAFEILTETSAFDDTVARLGLPIFVKPAREGSSIGISKVTRADQLGAAWKAAARYDGLVLAERGIVGREVTGALLGARVLPLIRLEAASGFYDYEAKYSRDDTRYHCPSGLSPELERRVQGLVREAFEAVGGTGWGRVDVMLDAQDNPYVLEVNTVPGMTDHSLVPKAAAAAGIGFDDLVIQILETSL